MKKASAGQLGLDLEQEEEGLARRRRRRRRAASGRARAVAGKARRRVSSEPALMAAPVVRRCGLCGTVLTVMGQAAVCPGCGGIVGRPQEQDGE